MTRVYRVRYSGPDRQGYVTHVPTGNRGTLPKGPHLATSKHAARTWPTRAAAERYVGTVLRVRLAADGEPAPNETIATIEEG